MFTNKSEDGRNNICGDEIRKRRMEMGKSQRQLADMLQIAGLDIDKKRSPADRIGKTVCDGYRIDVFFKGFGAVLRNASSGIK